MYALKSHLDAECLEEIKVGFLDRGLIIKESPDTLLVKYDREQSLMNDELTRECRSVIIDKHNKKILSVALKCKNTFQEFRDKIKWDNLVIEESVDGTLINLYYYNDKWNISTKGTLDGECRWASPYTFKDIFIDAAKKERLNYDLLKKNYCYSFVLCHPQCRNIQKYDVPKLVHVSSRNLDSLLETDEEIGIEKPNLLKLDKYNITGCNTYDELVTQVNTLPYYKEGYMLYNKSRNMRVKLIGKNFTYVKNLKGGYPIMDLRLIELRNTTDYNEFFKYFPEYLFLAKQIEFKIDILIKRLYEYYRTIKKNNIFIELPKVFKMPIYKLHELYSL